MPKAADDSRLSPLIAMPSPSLIWQLSIQLFPFYAKHPLRARASLDPAISRGPRFHENARIANSTHSGARFALMGDPARAVAQAIREPG